MNVIRLVRHSQFLRHNLVFFSGSVAVGALNYLYYPILGRMLTPGSFGEVQTLVSLFLQLSIFLIVLSQVVVNIVANYADEASGNLFVFEFEKLALALGIVMLLMSVLLRAKLQAFFHFASSWPFTLLALAIVATVPFTLRSAYLRGKQKFGLVSAGNIAGAGGKLVLSVILVALGFGTIGAIGGVVLSQVAACVLVAWWAFQRGLTQPKGRRFALPNMPLLLPELRYGFVVLVASLALTLQYSIDIVVIKHYFSADTAGLYAGIAAVARIIFFVTMSISQVLISTVKLRNAPEQNRQFLRKSLLLLAAISLPILIVLVAEPALVVRTLMGSSYSSLASLLPRLSIAVCIVAILNLFVAYYLALRRYGIAVVAVLGLGVSCALILLHHGSPKAVVDALLAGSAAMLGMFGVWALRERKHMV